MRRVVAEKPLSDDQAKKFMRLASGIRTAIGFGSWVHLALLVVSKMSPLYKTIMVSAQLAY
jgi:hypothetical protein